MSKNRYNNESELPGLIQYTNNRLKREIESHNAN